jgi:flagellar basal-body rod modification protein FlgD
MNMNISAIYDQGSMIEVTEKSLERAADKKPGDLGKDDFLNLLVTQLKYQDPLNPMDDKSFIAQMAQFSTLEQMQNMNSTFSHIKAFSLIGRNITASIADSTTKEIRQVDGYVNAVKISQGRAYVIVNNEDVPIDSITDIY